MKKKVFEQGNGSTCMGRGIWKILIVCFACESSGGEAWKLWLSNVNGKKSKFVIASSIHFYADCRQLVWLWALNSHCNKIHRWALNELKNNTHTDKTSARLFFFFSSVCHFIDSHIFYYCNDTHNTHHLLPIYCFSNIQARLTLYLSIFVFVSVFCQFSSWLDDRNKCIHTILFQRLCRPIFFYLYPITCQKYFLFFFVLNVYTSLNL